MVITPKVPSEPIINCVKIYPDAYFSVLAPVQISLARRQNYLQVENVFADGAVLNHPRPARAMRHITADKTTALAGRVNRVKQGALFGHRIHKSFGDNARLNNGLQVLLVYRQNLVKALHRH